MQTSFRKIELIRYLVAWRVNSAMVVLPERFPVELSYVLGSIIAKRLPTMASGRWQKALSPLQDYSYSSREKDRKIPSSEDFPNASWPVESVFFVYPGKATHGFGELIFWEFKLLANAADHGFFLETILPAMEEAGYTSDERWHRSNNIWGRFDIQAIYVARGARWEPLVKGGRLDLRYRANATQWAEGLTFGSGLKSAPNQLAWITPFELKDYGQSEEAPAAPEGREFPLMAILAALELRLNNIFRGKRKPVDALRDIIPDKGGISLEEAMDLAAGIPLLFKDLKSVPAGSPGRWLGKEVVASIPPQIIPWLDLASILHVGKHTHFGCGTFTLD